MSFLGGIWAKLIGLGAILLGLGAIVLRFFSQAKKAGVDQEHGRQADAWSQTQTNVDRAVAPVAGLDDAAVRDELRRDLAAAPGASPAVQPRPSAGSTDRR